MSLVCGICQLQPDEPVVSSVSGHVFEKRLIIKYINEFGKDPVVEEPLQENQLIEIKQYNKNNDSKLPLSGSIPSILSQLRDEWDACMLDSFEMKQNLMTTRQELSHALYQLDASYRVIARLKSQVEELQVKLKERDASNEK